MRIGRLSTRIGVGLLASERAAIFGAAGLPANADPGTLSLLGADPVNGHLEAAAFVPGGTIGTGGDVAAIAFVPRPGQTLVITGPTKGPTPPNGSKVFNIQFRYAFGLCRDTGVDSPSIAVRHRIEVSRSDGFSGTDTLTMTEPRFSNSNSGGAPTFTRVVTGICGTSGGTAWGGVVGDVSGTYGTGACTHSCPGWSGSCKGIWAQLSRNLNAPNAGGGAVITWRHVVEVTAACALQFVSTE